MAIIIEEENSKAGLGWGTVLTWVVVLLILAIAGYYVFFTHPQLVDTALPSNFRNTQEVSKIELRPEEVASNPIFKSLRPETASQPSGSPGRANPFAPFGR